MLDVLQSYLQEAAPPELRLALEDAHRTFDRINLQNFEEGFEELLMIDDNTDFGGTTEAIVNLTGRLLRKLLEQHAVVLVSDASIETMNLFVNGLLDIQNYENHEDVVRTASLDANPQEIFAELMALVTPCSVEELMMDIESVSITVIGRIKELASTAGANPVSEETQAQIRKYIEGFQRFRKYLGNPQLTITKMLATGIDVGYPFTTYLNLLGRQLEEMPVDKATFELVGMALVSSDGCDNPRAMVKSHLEHVISDIDKITKIDIKMGEILLGLQR